MPPISANFCVKKMKYTERTKAAQRPACRLRPPPIQTVRLLIALGFRLVGTEKVSFYRDAQGQDIVFDGGIFTLEQGRTP